MVVFFGKETGRIIAVASRSAFSSADEAKLVWLFGGLERLKAESMDAPFIGPRKEMITPWSSNAVDIVRNMGIAGVLRVEEFSARRSGDSFDPMLQAAYERLDQRIFSVDRRPEPVRPIDDIAAYNAQEGLALSEDEVRYLEDLAERIGRPLTDSEVFGFSQVNSEHCRHKIFNGTFVIDGVERKGTLFELIKKTSRVNAGRLVSAYKDNCAFFQGPVIARFSPDRQDAPGWFFVSDVGTVLSLKAETHNFPTTVEPFNGAATGSGGEIRDRIGGGRGGIPLAGTAVYMTSYPRLSGAPEGERVWEKRFAARSWLYHTPEEILIRASNGASDFGNKFGQPLVCGSLLSFEHEEQGRRWGFDKTIMLAGGIGWARADAADKEAPRKGDRIAVLGGDNYRIGMGGGAVSSVDTGHYTGAIELNAVQRSNPEMQKRVYNVIRAVSEAVTNPFRSIHDHGAGGHLNCLSELVADEGGAIDLSRLPVGDPTLSAKELVGNESQERMGVLVGKEDIETLEKIAARERSPFYDVGEITGDHRLVFRDSKTGESPIDLVLEDFFGNPPRTMMKDSTVPLEWKTATPDAAAFETDLASVLRLESVACKDWLTNKVDRCVTGLVAFQQTAGPLQLPVNDLGVMALDYRGRSGIATAIGHAPAAMLVDPAKGVRLSIAEALTNLVFAPIVGGLSGVSLSANWMWPCRNPGEDARLYAAVEAASEFACALGVNIPTGKDSLSMTQKYPDGTTVLAPGTVIVSAAGEVSEVRKTLSAAALAAESETRILYLPFGAARFGLGASAWAQTKGVVGDDVPDAADAASFASAFEAVQRIVREGLALAGHDVSAGGLVVALLEMLFPVPGVGMDVDLSGFEVANPSLVLFSENPAVLLQVPADGVAESVLASAGVPYRLLGTATKRRSLNLACGVWKRALDVDALRDVWYETSFLLDRRQSGETLARARFDNYKKQALDFKFPASFTGRAPALDIRRRPGSASRAAINSPRAAMSSPCAAVIREQGVNGDREMAWALHLAGFDVRDVHMSDLVSGRETLEDLSFVVFPGGFANSDVLGSAKGWAGSFLFNPKAKQALDAFYARPDTLSLGVCNGCQLVVHLGLLYPEYETVNTAWKPRLDHNASGKFESIFLSVDVVPNDSVMLGPLAGSRLGIWVAHGEGRFRLEGPETAYRVALRYAQSGYPGNPNLSDRDVAGLCSNDGRHLAMMPHLERSVLPWQWGHYPRSRNGDETTPWIEAFVNARRWVEDRR